MNYFLDRAGLTFLWEQLKLRFVATEAGKGLSTNDLDNNLLAQINALLENTPNYQNEGQVTSAIMTAISAALASYSTSVEVTQMIADAIEGFDHNIFIVVNELPEIEDAEANKIYILTVEGGIEMWTVVVGDEGEEWIKTATTAIDLSGYWNASNLTALTNAEILAILDEN